MKKLRASIADRREADALNRDWDTYVRSVGHPPADTSAALRHLHCLDDAPLPDSVFLARTWQQLRARMPASDASPDPLRRADVLARGLRRRTHGGNRRSPSMRVVVAALGLAVLVVTLFVGRLVPAGGETTLVASALASAAPAVGSPAHRIATRQPLIVDAAPKAPSSRADPARATTVLSTHTATPGTPSR